MTERPVILLEFNELCPSLMHRFMGEGKLPNFQRLYGESDVYTTDAEEESPYLEPWIQWVTVHSGLSYREHQVFHLSDGHTLGAKCIWDVLSMHGRRVWVCGSMNIRYDRPLNGLVLPDPWATETFPSDARFKPYFEFVQKNVLEYTNDSVPLSAADTLRFLYFMATHGLSFDTTRAILGQLFAEQRGQCKWKRATLLDKLQFDVFAHFYRELKPAFSTFFLNSTAHYQHLYWRNMAPDLFTIRPTADEEEYSQAILYGYQEMDKLVARFEELAEDNTTLIFCTALSQQPCLKYDADGGKSFYRPKDFRRLLEFAGIEGVCDIVPVMSENFQIRFESERLAAVAREQLARLRVAGSTALFLEQRGSSLYSGCGIHKLLSTDAMLAAGEGGSSAPFFEYFYRVDGMKSGMHHPEGMLWIRQPDRKHHLHRQTLPLTSVAPMILDMFSVPKPEFMRARSAPDLATVCS